METTKNDLPPNAKKFFHNLSEYLETKMLYYGSIQRSDYVPGKSDIDVDIFTDNEYSLMSKMQHYLHLSKSKFKKVVYIIDNKTTNGYKVKYTNKAEQLKVEFAIYNEKFKDIIIKEHTRKRKIIVRPHPGDKKINGILKINHKNVFLSTNKHLVDDLKNAWATVVYNSSPSVASAIEGVPVFLTDPQPKNSQSFDIANIDISNIENPVLLDRQHWIEKISMCHWKFDELRSGKAWNFFKRYI